MLVTLDWVIIIAFLLLSLAISLYYRQQAGKSLSDFFLGGRNLPWYIAGISMVATTFAADTPLAVTELVADHGISGNWLWWSFLTGGMLTTFFFARLWRRAGVLTEVELIELRYSGIGAKLLRGFKSIYLGLFMNVMIIGWVNVALASILQGLFNIPEHEVVWYIAGAMLLTAVYSTMSGLKGVAITDMVQFTIAMIGTILLAYFVISSEQIGGITGLQAQLSDKPWVFNFFPSINDDASATGTALTLTVGAFLARIGVQWWSSWYPGAEPGGGGYVAQRMLSAKSEDDAVYATLFFQIAHYCLRPWPWILVGLAALVLYPDLTETNSKMGYIYAIRDFMPVGLKGLLVVAFLAAYMSTISTQLNWGASYLVNDFYKRFILKRRILPHSDLLDDDLALDAKEVQNRRLVAASRITTIILAIAGIAVTPFIDSISGVWEFIIESGAGLGFILIIRWYWWRINSYSEIAATITPFILYGITRFGYGMGFPDGFFITVAGTIIVSLVVTLITPPTDEHTLRKFYQKVRPEGNWGPVRTHLGLTKVSSNIPLLVVCWLSAVSLTYSILFATGKFIFMDYNLAVIWLGVAVVSFFILRFGMGRVTILAKE